MSYALPTAACLFGFLWQVLRPGLVKGQWDAEEDAALMKLATAPFKNWGTLSTQMSGEVFRAAVRWSVAAASITLLFSLTCR